MVDLRINETRQTGAVRRPHLPFSRLVGTVSNSADAVRLETAPTGGESVYLFLEFTIILRAGQVREDPSVPPINRDRRDRGYPAYDVEDNLPSSRQNRSENGKLNALLSDILTCFIFYQYVKI